MGLGKESDNPVIQKQMPRFQKCYTKSLKKRPKNSGRVVIEWEVNDSGKTESVSINMSNTTLMDTKVHFCILNVFKGLQFPPAPQGEVTNDSYSFNFEKKR